MFVFSSDCAVESPFGLSRKRPTELYPVPEQLTVGFKSAKLDSIDCVAVVDCLSSDSSPSSCEPIKRPELTSIHMTVDLKTKGPLSYSESGSCDHNGGVLTSKYGDLIVTIPKGAIEDGDSVTLSLSSNLYGPFVLPTKRQSDVVSPYYWIGASGSYHFQKPVQVEFQHFAVVTACDPSHYQLLCCEDDDESCTMQSAVGYNPRFTVRGYISWCTFYTDNFCSYCLFPGCKDPVINRIAAIYLKSKDSHCFTTEIWFSFPINQCLERNKELYTKQGMELDHKCNHIFEAPCGISSTNLLTLTYHQDFDGWDVKHCRSKQIKTKEINFYNYYKTMKELKTIEDNSLFPPRFIVNVKKKSGCNTDLNTEMMITLYTKNEGEEIESIPFSLFVQMSALVEMITNRSRVSITDSVAQIIATNAGTFLLDLICV